MVLLLIKKKNMSFGPKFPMVESKLIIIGAMDIQDKEKSSLTRCSRFVLQVVTFICHPRWPILN